MVFKFCWSVGREIQCLTHGAVGLPDCEISNESHGVFWGHIMNWGGHSKSCSIDAAAKSPLGEDLEEDIWDTGRVCTEDPGRELKLKFLGLQDHQSEMGGEQVLGMCREYLSVLSQNRQHFHIVLMEIRLRNKRFISANICMHFFSSHVWSRVEKINCIHTKDIVSTMLQPKFTLATLARNNKKGSRDMEDHFLNCIVHSWSQFGCCGDIILRRIILSLHPTWNPKLWIVFQTHTYPFLLSSGFRSWRNTK